ncbi:MAG TPA: ABC transporter ATP-binding protein [Acholeplasma sp.]
MFKTLTKFISLTFKLRPVFYLLSLFEALIQTSRLVFGLYATKLIIDSVMASQFEQTLWIAGALVLLQLLLNLLSKAFDQLRHTERNELVHRINQLIAESIMKFQYDKLEDPYYLDLRERAKFAYDNQGVAWQLLSLVTRFISIAISLASLGVVLFMFDIWLVVALGVVLILNFISFSLSNRTQISLTNQMIPVNRKFGYYLNTLLSPENAKDYRFSNMDELIHEKASAFTYEATGWIKNLFFTQGMFSWVNDVINYLLMGFTYIYIAVKTIAGEVLLSDFIFYTGTVLSVSNELVNLVGAYAELKRNTEWIKPFFELLAVPQENHDDAHKLSLERIETIEFDDVSFKYPKTDTMILNHVSFKINKGEKISVVGLNGAGKTTLVKLLSRLYKPTSGKILINGIDIWEYKHHDYMEKLAAVFQDYKIFAYSITENIAGKLDHEGAYDAASKVSLSQKIKSLPKGMESTYSKSLYQDGIELSGGEQQKIAIARALYKGSDLIILDEPTAALDPLAEAEIYEHFNELVKDKTAIYISHRMSSSVFCDKILVLNHGVVEDYLPHKQLMKKKESLYYKLFTTQAQNYQS